MHAVDPLVRIVHKPTFEAQFALFMRDRSSQPPAKGFEALVFAMYFASVASMHPEAVYARYGITKPDLQARYRTATEQALANAGFLQSKRLTTLQALVLFVVSAPDPVTVTPANDGIVDAARGGGDTEHVDADRVGDPHCAEPGIAP